jgi:hypothetical protein
MLPSHERPGGTAYLADQVGSKAGLGRDYMYIEWRAYTAAIGILPGNLRSGLTGPRVPNGGSSSADSDVPVTVLASPRREPASRRSTPSRPSQSRRTVRNLDDDGRLLWITDAKTQAGVRRLEVPPQLQEHLQRLARDKRPADRLFGRNVHRHWVLRAVRRICKAAGVPRVPSHGLRGTHATLAVLPATSSRRRSDTSRSPRRRATTRARKPSRAPFKNACSKSSRWFTTRQTGLRSLQKLP